MKENMNIEFAYNGRTEFDNVRRQKIVHKVYRDVDNPKTYVEVLDYVDME